MTTFDEREHAFEAKFAHDQDMQFRAIVQRNRAIAAWAATKLGRTGEDAENYVKSIVAAGIAKPGDAVIIEKIQSDFRAGNVSAPRSDIEAMLGQFMGEAMLAQTKG